MEVWSLKHVTLAVPLSQYQILSSLVTPKKNLIFSSATHSNLIGSVCPPPFHNHCWPFVISSTLAISPTQWSYFAKPCHWHWRGPLHLESQFRSDIRVHWGLLWPMVEIIYRRAHLMLPWRPHWTSARSTSRDWGTVCAYQSCSKP